MMMGYFYSIEKLFFSSTVQSSLRVIGIAIGIIIFSLFASRWLGRIVTKRSSAQQGMIVRKLFAWGGFGLAVYSLVRSFGIDLTPLLGAAGIVGIALGFASQTSVSNVISGIFLIAERSFSVGDAITIGDVTGQVISIDMLSIKLRTFDNRFVRIPNETLIKSQVVNISHFPVRRIDISVSLAHEMSIPETEALFLRLCTENPLVLQEPEPQIIVNGFGQSSLDILFTAWAERDDWLLAKRDLCEQVLQEFKAHHIDFARQRVEFQTAIAAQVAKS
jgi:small-conductance mechanosensitive channel